MDNTQVPTQKSGRRPSWVLGLVFLAIVVGLGYWAFSGNGDGNTTVAGTTTENGQTASGDGGSAAPPPVVYQADALNVGVCTWPGYGTAILFNNGLLANDQSRFTKEFGLKVNINVMDDPSTNRPAFSNGEIDLIWATIDAFSSEAKDLSAPPAYTKVCFATDCSAGADVIVSVEGIKSISDLRGKRVAFAGLSPSASFLMSMLATSGMTLDDIIIDEVATPMLATEHFTNREADAAVVWSPDDQTCLKTVEGSHMLTSTKTASNLIYNVFLVRNEYLAQHSDRLVKFFTGWMIANAELKAGGDEATAQVAQALVDNMSGFASVSDAEQAMGRVKFLTMGDNLNLFGMNSEYKGAVASDIYTKFGKMYKQASKITTVPAWSSVFDKSILVAVSKNLKGAQHKAEGRKEFTPVTKEIENEPALTHLSVTVNFETGSATLDSEAKNIIKTQFGDAVKYNRDARIRVVGNTDNTGSAAANTKLSLRRANAVKAYLVSEYDSDPNRFIIIGNGPKAAIADGIDGESEEYRRTDFELVQD